MTFPILIDPKLEVKKMSKYVMRGIKLDGRSQLSNMYLTTDSKNMTNVTFFTCVIFCVTPPFYLEI